jgi:hypothetical protein
MKKTSLFLAMVAIIYSSISAAGTKNNRSKDTAQSTNTINEKKKAIADPFLSLNGIPEPSVKAMTDDFAGTVLNQIIPHAKMSTWFKLDILKQMITLLQHQRNGRSSETMGVADGIRIYFIAQTADKADLSVAVVATTNNGRENDVPLHKDYYIDPQLFTTLKDIGGEKCNGNCGGGAVLYTRCADPNCDDEDCSVVSPEHRISRSFGERLTAAFGNNKINTQSVWFDFEFIESLSKITEPGFDGIRVYCANYGEINYDGSPIDDEVVNGYQVKRNRDTFVITPTKSRSTTVYHDDIFKCKTAEQNLKRNGLRNKKTKSKKVLITKDINKKFAARKFEGYDNGELCPSHCN